MKKIIAALLAAAALTAGASALAAESTEEKELATVTLNGEALAFDESAFIENGRTLVPMRGIFEAVGASVYWDDEKQTVFASRTKDGETTYVTLQIGTTAFINETEFALDVPAKLVGDRTFVPLRFVIEALGEKVDWDESTSTVIITTDE